MEFSGLILGIEFAGAQLHAHLSAPFSELDFVIIGELGRFGDFDRTAVCSRGGCGGGVMSRSLGETNGRGGLAVDRGVATTTAVAIKGCIATLRW
jgi:hypothetical protein